MLHEYDAFEIAHGIVTDKKEAVVDLALGLLEVPRVPQPGAKLMQGVPRVPQPGRMRVPTLAEELMAVGSPIGQKLKLSYQAFLLRGQHRQGTWVFGGIEREIGKTFMEIVAARNTQTLEQAILGNILPGTHIVSDVWAAYGNINQLAGGIYVQKVVVHAQNIENDLNADEEEMAESPSNILSFLCVRG